MGWLAVGIRFHGVSILLSGVSPSCSVKLRVYLRTGVDSVVSADINNVHQRDSIAMLCTAGLALPAFIFWVHRQVRAGKPALIPNSLWRNHSFSTICATILVSFAVLKSMEQYCSLLCVNIPTV